MIWDAIAEVFCREWTMKFASADKRAVKEKLTEQTIAGEKIVKKLHTSRYMIWRWVNCFESACLLLDGSFEVDHG